MSAPAWLAELHRQWLAARGAKSSASVRSFRVDWEDLLDDAKLVSADQRSVAKNEAEALEKEGRVSLKRHRYRDYIIEKVAVPVDQEAWLATQFGTLPGHLLRAQSLQVVAVERAAGHPRWPESWERLCTEVDAAFTHGTVLKPFRWRVPQEVAWIFSAVRALTERDWKDGTVVGDASSALGWGAKLLDRRRRTLESALTRLFNEPSPLESLGLIGSHSRALIQGPLVLHFEDGTQQDVSNLRGGTTLSHLDLQRAVRATTSAARILSVENTKYTFPQAVAANRTGEALLIATSHPNGAVRRLLELLPLSLPHFHFGDTDASGYAILRSLRRVTARLVTPFLMAWEDDPASPALSEHDRRVLPGLLADEALKDCWPQLKRMAAAGRKGAFEQERFAAPGLIAWPFWKQAESMHS